MTCTPLQPETSDKTTRKELEPFQRGIIIGRYLAGQKQADIQRAMGLPYSTIRVTIKKYKTSTTGTSAPRSGRPQALSDSDKQYIHLLIKRDPFIKVEDICKSLDKPVSQNTVSRELKRSGYAHWKAQKKTPLKQKNS